MTNGNFIIRIELTSNCKYVIMDSQDECLSPTDWTDVWNKLSKRLSKQKISDDSI